MLDRLSAWIFPAAASVPSTRDQLIAVAATFLGIFIIGLTASLMLPSPASMIFVASMGASALLVFVIPNSPLAQPYPIIMGHIVATFVGVTVVYYFDDPTLAAALTVSLGLAGMFLTNSMHPPGGAAALVPVIAGNEAIGGYQFLLFPVLLNVVTLILIGITINRFLLKKDYPVAPKKKHHEIHHHKDPSPLARLGIRSEDIRSAIEAQNAFLNITEKDLEKIYDQAQMQAYTRNFGEIRCKDIMSKDVITVEYGTGLEDAWALLRLHKVKILPVIDEVNRVIGVLSLVDYLKRANLKTYRNFAENLVYFIRKSTAIDSRKPELVGQIMAKPPFTVSENDLISSLVPLLSDKGLHHIPVVDEKSHLSGIITQSDLIAALYQGAISKH